MYRVAYKVDLRCSSHTNGSKERIFATIVRITFICKSCAFISQSHDIATQKSYFNDTKIR